MRTLSATDLALAMAIKAGTLKVETKVSRFGEEFFALSDDVGLIEVQMSQTELDTRLSDISGRAAL